MLNNSNFVSLGILSIWVGNMPPVGKVQDSTQTNGSLNVYSFLTPESRTYLREKGLLPPPLLTNPSVLVYDPKTDKPLVIFDPKKNKFIFFDPQKNNSPREFNNPTGNHPLALLFTRPPKEDLFLPRLSPAQHFYNMLMEHDRYTPYSPFDTLPFELRKELKDENLIPYQFLTYSERQEVWKKHQKVEEERREEESRSYRRHVYLRISELIPRKFPLAEDKDPTDYTKIDYSKLPTSTQQNIEMLSKELEELRLNQQDLDPFTFHSRSSELLKALQKTYSVIKGHIAIHGSQRETRPEELAKQLIKFVGTPNRDQIADNVNKAVSGTVFSINGEEKLVPRLEIPESINIQDGGKTITLKEFMGRALKDIVLDPLAKEINRESRRIDQGVLLQREEQQKTNQKTNNALFIKMFNASTVGEHNLKSEILNGILNKMSIEDQDKLIKHFKERPIANLIEICEKKYGDGAGYLSNVWNYRNSGWKEEARTLMLIEIGYMIYDDLKKDVEIFKQITHNLNNHTFEVKNPNGLCTNESEKSKLVGTLGGTLDELDGLIEETKILNQISDNLILKKWGVQDEKVFDVLINIINNTPKEQRKDISKKLLDLAVRIEVFNSLSPEVQKKLTGTEGDIDPLEVVNELQSGCYYKVDYDSRTKRILKDPQKLYLDLESLRLQGRRKIIDLGIYSEGIKRNKEARLSELEGVIREGLPWRSRWIEFSYSWIPYVTTKGEEYDEETKRLINFICAIDEAHENNSKQLSELKGLQAEYETYSLIENPFYLLLSGNLEEANKALIKQIKTHGARITINEPLLFQEIIRFKENPQSIYETGLLQRLFQKGELDEKTHKNIMRLFESSYSSEKTNLAVEIIGGSVNLNKGEEIQTALALDAIDNDPDFLKILDTSTNICNQVVELNRLCKALQESNYRGEYPIKRIKDLACKMQQELNDAEGALKGAKEKIKKLERLLISSTCAVERDQINSRIRTYRQLIADIENKEMKNLVSEVRDESKWNDSTWVTSLCNKGPALCVAIGGALLAAAAMALAIKTCGGTLPVAIAAWTKTIAAITYLASVGAASAGALIAGELYAELVHSSPDSTDGTYWGARSMFGSLPPEERTAYNFFCLYGAQWGKDTIFNAATMRAGQFIGSNLGKLVTNSRLINNTINYNLWLSLDSKAQYLQHNFSRVATTLSKVKDGKEYLGKICNKFAEKLGERMPAKLRAALHGGADFLKEVFEECGEDVIASCAATLSDFEADLNWVGPLLIIAKQSYGRVKYDPYTRKGSFPLHDKDKLTSSVGQFSSHWNTKETIDIKDGKIKIEFTPTLPKIPNPKIPDFEPITFTSNESLFNYNPVTRNGRFNIEHMETIKTNLSKEYNVQESTTGRKVTLKITTKDPNQNFKPITLTSEHPIYGYMPIVRMGNFDIKHKDRIKERYRDRATIEESTDKKGRTVLKIKIEGARLITLTSWNTVNDLN